MFVKIVGRPSGEAPEWVRDAWIGLRLPLALRRKRKWIGHGVLTGPRGLIPQLWAFIRGRTIRTTGYAVNAKIAVDRLAETSPAAASWWRENVPMVLDGRRYFVFDEDACQVESGTSDQG
jgi:hypothetical protein